MAIVKCTRDEAKKLKGDTDYARIYALTDEQIEEAARNDSSSALPTFEQLKRFKRGSLNDKK